MNPLAVPFLLLAATITAPLAAQTQDPAPIRIAADTYGSASGGSGRILGLRLDTATPGAPEIVVSGGAPGGIAVLLAGGAAASTPGPGGTMLLVSLVAVVPIGTFFDDGTAHLPFDIVRKDLIGRTVFLQALSISPSALVSLSAGLSVRFAAGSVQPTLGYKGPPSSAVLLAMGRGAGQTHQVLHDVTVPTSGWRLFENSRTSGGGVTRLYMTLEAPGPHEITNDVIETQSCVVALGSTADPLIEVWIEQIQRGTPGPPVFLLAAWIQRDF